MAKVRKRKNIGKGGLPPIVKQHNQELRYKRGEVVVEVGEEPDDPKRQVTRLRRNCVYDEMMNRGTITKEQRNCAERYEILCERAVGSTSCNYARISLWVDRGLPSNFEPTPAQHQAYGQLFWIWKGLGKYMCDILNAVILGNLNCKEIAGQKNTEYQRMIGQVQAVFMRLEEVMA